MWPAKATAMNIMDELREATRADHKRIENSLRLMDDDMPLSTYVRTLERFYGYYEPLEYRLCSNSGVTNVLDDLDHRRKVPLLRRDLEHWGCDERTLPRCSRVPRINDAFDALGCLYVIEGATLGGRILSRYFQLQFGTSEKAGGAFFEGYGERTGAMWKAFGRAVEAIPLTADQSAKIIQNAHATFRTLQCWCTENFI